MVRPVEFMLDVIRSPGHKSTRNKSNMFQSRSSFDVHQCLKPETCMRRNSSTANHPLMTCCATVRPMSVSIWYATYSVSIAIKAALIMMITAQAASNLTLVTTVTTFGVARCNIDSDLSTWRQSYMPDPCSRDVTFTSVPLWLGLPWERHETHCAAFSVSHASNFSVSSVASSCSTYEHGREVSGIASRCFTREQGLEVSSIASGCSKLE
mmetsp:Transcript_89693/g.252894  ORF Transcript_89693/g.252894 Transcript_89693/m.252894 type:complete len:210 (-) Transcript_89693:243-872(-)